MTTKAIRTITCFLACREVWLEQCPEVVTQAQNYASFAKWIRQLEEAKRSAGEPSPHPPAVANLLHVLLDGRDIRNYETASLAVGGLFNQHLHNYYRIAFATDMHPGESDRRVRQFVLHLCNCRLRWYPYTSLLVPFFTCSVFRPARTTAKQKDSIFLTEPSTRWEQLLFLSALVHISKFRKDKGSHIPSLKRLGRKGAQRIGKSIQLLVRAWDRFSFYLGFQSVEQLCTPYVFLDNNLVYKVVDSRSDGYVSRRSAKEFHISPSLTHDPTQVSQFALSITDTIDNSLREIVSDFLSDIYAVTEYDELYSCQDQGPFRFYESLKVPTSCSTPSASQHTHMDTDLLPNHFLRYPYALTANIRSSVEMYKSPKTVPHRVLLRIRCRPPSDTPLSKQPPRKRRKSDAPKTASGSTVYNVPKPLHRRTLNDLLRTPPLNAGKGASSEEDANPGASVPELAAIKQRDLHSAISNLYNIVGDKFALLDTGFENFANALRLKYGHLNIIGKTQLVLIDPPRNIRDYSYDTLNHDQIIMTMAQTWIELFTKAPNLPATKLRCEDFEADMEDTDDDSSSDESEEGESTGRTPTTPPHRKSSLTKSTFTVDQVPIVFSWHPSQNKGSSSKRKNSILVNMNEYAIHVKRNGLTSANEFEMENTDRNFNFVGCSYPPWKNTINNIKDLPPHEQVRVTFNPSAPDGTDSRNSTDTIGSRVKTYALRSDQKPIALIQELIARYSRPGDIVIDFFAGTFSTAIAAMSLPGHRRFFGCEIDVRCHAAAKLNFLIALSKTIYYRANDILFDMGLYKKAMCLITTVVRLLTCGSVENAVFPGNLYLKRVDPLTVLAGDKRWRAPAPYPHYQRFSSAILAALSSMWNDHAFVRMANSTPFQKWTERYQGLLQQVSMEDLLLVESSANNLIIAKSTIQHPLAGKGAFAAQTFRKDQVICQYYGTLVYHDLTKRHQEVKSAYSCSHNYGHGVLAVDCQRFAEYAIQVSVRPAAFPDVTTIDKKNGLKTVYVVPFKFCTAAYINDYNYHHMDKQFQAAMNNRIPDAHRRVPNVQFQLKTDNISHPDHLENQAMINVIATRTINPGQELFTSYEKCGVVTSLC